MSPDETGPAAEEPAPSEPVDQPTSGVAYLRQRRASLEARDSHRGAAVAGGADIHANLGRIAVDARQHRPQDPSLSGDRRWMVLNGAYLVEDSSRERFAAAVEALAEEHGDLAVELTGPWPAYSFAAIGDGEPE